MEQKAQRRFIYLRQTGSGRESGYARLENSDDKWRFSVVVQGFSVPAMAKAGLWRENAFHPLGDLHFDATGRGGLTTSLRPETLSTSSLLCIVREQNGEADIPLAAVPGKGEKVDIAAVLSALKAPAAVPVSMPETEKEAVSFPVSAPQTEEKPSVQREEPYLQAEKELQTPIVPESEGEVPVQLQAVYWPQKLWSMVDLFEKFPEAATPGGNVNRVCVRVPLSGTFGEPDHYLLGVELNQDRVTALGVLLPGDYAPTPPTGMSDYLWSDDYWQLWQSVSD